MASEIKLPELGENLEGGEILAVKVAVGDTVTAGQPLFELEAEKSTVEVPAPTGGKILDLAVKKGDYVSVGQMLGRIDGPSAQAKTEEKREPAAEAAKPQEAEAKKEAPKAKEPSPADENGAKPAKPEKAAPAKDGQSAPPAPASTGDEKLVPAGPATRRLAREMGVDLRQVAGTSMGGRVTQEDVKDYVRQLAAHSVVAAPTPGAKVPPLPDFAKWGPVERQRLEPVRRKTAEQMSLAWSLIPHVTQHDQADITDLGAFRKAQEGSGPKLTVTAFALKASAVALREFPQFNSSLDSASAELVLKRYFHIGVAVDTPRGLLVPVIRDVDRKSVKAIAQEMIEIAERARNGQVPIEEMRGGTFTITNLGGLGGTGFTPIVNYPEVAILGLSRARLQPTIRDGQVVPRLILPISVSYDHRVIDGADAARFTRRLAALLENPLLLLLEA